ncbi:hypothetical protein B7486_70290 [cyanobacterium TDX16]|nr:hypothetical protein B7486_70290 [cyanobacterium TDX16]
MHVGTLGCRRLGLVILVLEASVAIDASLATVSSDRKREDPATAARRRGRQGCDERHACNAVVIVVT